MAQNKLTSTGRAVPRRSIRKLTLVEEKKESEIAKRSKFNKLTTDKLGESMDLPPNELKPSLSDANDFDFYSRESDSDEPIGWLDGDPLESDGTTVFENSRSGTLFNAEILLPQGEDLIAAKIKGRHVDDNN